MKRCERVCNHLYRDTAVRSSDDADDWLRLIDDVRVGSVVAAEHGRIEDVERGTDVVERLVEGVRFMRAGVEHVGAQSDARQQRPVTVDVIDGEQHRLEPLDAAVLLDVATAARRHFSVHREQSADHDVAVDVGGCLLGGLRLGGRRSDTQLLLLPTLNFQLLATNAR